VLHHNMYRVFNPVTRRITTYVHVMFQSIVLGFGVSLDIDYFISSLLDVVDGGDHMPLLHATAPDARVPGDGPPLTNVCRPSRL
jgi:hypothetical protein